MAVVAGGTSRVTGIDGRVGIFQAGPRRGPQASRPPARASGRRRAPPCHDARLRPRPPLLDGDEVERHLAMQEKLPAVVRANVHVLVGPGGDEGIAADVTHRFEARPSARPVVRFEDDRQVVDVVHAALEALPQRAQVRRDRGVAPVRARAVWAVVPDDRGVAEGEERRDVGVGMARVSAILDEAVLVVQLADFLAILQPSQSNQQVLVARPHLWTVPGYPDASALRDGSRAVLPEPPRYMLARNTVGETPASSRNSAFMCAWS